MPMKAGSEKWVEAENFFSRETEAASKYAAKQSQGRTDRWNRYKGRPLGNEVSGRSEFMSRDMLDTIEWMLPSFIKTFLSGDSKISLVIKDQPPIVAKALMKKIVQDLDNSVPSLFILGYVWIKDALVSGTSFVKPRWNFEEEWHETIIPEATLKTLKEIDANPKAEILDYDEEVESDALYDYTQQPDGTFAFQDQGPRYLGVKIRVKTPVDEGLRCDNVAPWNFICHEKCRHINDRYGKGFESEYTLDELKKINRARSVEGEPDYFQRLDYFKVDENGTLFKAERPERGMALDSDDERYGEREEYYADEGGYEDTMLDFSEELGKRPIKVREWYDKYDLDGDGFMEDVVVWFAEDIMIRIEKNSEGFVSASALSPMVDCYKLFGQTPADVLVSVQNLKTMLIRRILDNWDYANSGRWLVDPDAGVDVRTLLQNVPGDVVFGDTDGVTPLVPGQVDMSTGLALIEWADGTKEQNTGITRYNQGMDADSLNKTARGIMQIQAASQQRTDLMSRVFAETGFRDFFHKCALQYQLYMREPFTVEVDGKQVTITPEMIQGKITTKVNLGIESFAGQTEIQKIQGIWAAIDRVAARFPAISTPQNEHTMLTRYIRSSGFQEVNDFIPPVDAFVQGQQQMQKVQQQMQQAMQAMQQMQQQLEAMKVQGKIAGDKGKLEQKERDSARQAQIDLIEIMAELKKALALPIVQKKLEQSEPVFRFSDEQPRGLMP